MAHTLRLKQRVCCVLAAVFAHFSVAVALETDQFYAWDRELDDATEVLNAKFCLEIQRALDELNRSLAGRSAGPDAVARAVMRRLKFVIFQDIEVWALHSGALSRVPATADETLAFRKSYLYHRKGFLDMSGWMPPSPTIEVDGIRFGTDKLAHFVSGGWRYYRRFHGALGSGCSIAQAERRAIEVGFLWEDSILGTLSTGVLSLGDMEANYRGLLFYRDVCEGEDPIVVRWLGEWRMRRPFDIRDYVTVEWDESYHPSILTPRRWRLARPVQDDYVEKLSNPGVAARRGAYRRRDDVTPTEKVVAELVGKGKLADPRQFGVGDEGGGGVSIPPHERRWPDDRLVEELLWRERTRKWSPVGMLGLSATYPEKVSFSCAVLLARLPVEHDPRIVTAFAGPFAQVQVGVGGARGSLGWAEVFGETRGDGFLLREYFLGYGAKVSVLRMHGDSCGREPRQAFCGVEAEFTIVRVNFETGVFYRVDGPDEDEPWLVTGGVGVGF